MDTIPRYIRDRGYDIEDEFLTTIREIDRDIAFKIAIYIEENIKDITPNVYTTYIFGGVIHHKKKPVTFALEVLKLEGRYITLTDLSFIDMDEYLDLICLDSYIKPEFSSELSLSKICI